MKTIFSFLSVMVLSLHVFSQNPYSKTITINDVKTKLYTLASPDMEGRGTGQPGQRKAAEYIASEFAKIGLLPLVGSSENKYFQRFIYNNTIDSTENVLGYLSAGSPGAEWIVITAHYDHNGKMDDKIYYGADDNASGTTAVLELAEAFALAKQSGIVFNKNILFIAFSAEEWGLLGSKHFVYSPPGDTLNMTLNVNMDMIGKSIRYGMVETFAQMENEHFKEDTTYRENFVYVFNKGRHTGKYTRLARISARQQHIKIDKTPGLLTRMLYKTSSDHKHFYDADIPIMVFFTGLHPDYHTPRDTPEKIDYENLTGIIKIIFETVYNIAIE